MKRLLISLAIACAVLCGLPPAAQAAPTTAEIPVTKTFGGFGYPSTNFLNGAVQRTIMDVNNQFTSMFSSYASDNAVRNNSSPSQWKTYVYVAPIPGGVEARGQFTIGGLLGLVGGPSGEEPSYDAFFSNLSRGCSFILFDDGEIVLSDDLGSFSSTNFGLQATSLPLINSHATTPLNSLEYQSYFDVDGTIVAVGYFLCTPPSSTASSSSGTPYYVYPAFDDFYYMYDPDVAFQGGVLAILGDIWDTITYIPSQILEGMAQVIAGLLEGLQVMFLPPDDFMLEVWQDVTEDFESQFGAIGYTVNYVIDLLQDLDPENRPGFGSHDDEFYFPGINLEIPIFGHSYFFKIDDGWIKCFPEGLEEYQEKVKFLVTAGFCLAAMTGWIRLYEARLGIDSDFDGDEEG